MTLKLTNKVLTWFLQERDNDDMTLCLLSPSPKAVALCMREKENLEKQLEQVLSQQNKDRPLHNEYYHHLELGSVYFALGKYDDAARCFSVSMQFPKKNRQSETDQLFEFPCLLAGAAYQLAGKPGLAINVYEQGIEYCKHWGGVRVFSENIQRCQKNTVSLIKIPKTISPLFEQMKLEDSPVEYTRASLYTLLGMPELNGLLSTQFSEFCFSQISPDNLWRMSVDGRQQKQASELGWLGWEERERYSITAMERVLHYVRHYGVAPITCDTIKTMHALATGNVSGLNGNDCPGNEWVKQGEFRTTTVAFNISIGIHATGDGIEELVAFIKEFPGVALLDQNLSSGLLKYTYTAREPSKNLQEQVERVLQEYHEHISQVNPDNYRETIRLIVRCLKKIELLHPFRDANCRVVYALLHLMLLQNHLPISLLDNPNRFDGYSEEEMVDEVLKGMKSFVFLKQNGFAPGSKPNREILKEALKKASKEQSVLTLLQRDLMRSIQYGNVALFQLYIESGFSFTARTEWGNTILSVAAYFGQLEMVKVILNLCPQLLNVPGQAGATPVYLAAYQGHEAVVAYLLERGADIHIRSVYGLDAAAIAQERGFIALAEALHQVSVIPSVVKPLKNRAGSDTNSVFFQGIANQDSDSSLSFLVEYLSDFSSFTKALVLLERAENEVFHYRHIQLALLNKLEAALKSPEQFTNYLDKWGDDKAWVDLYGLNELINKKLANNKDHQLVHQLNAISSLISNWIKNGRNSFIFKIILSEFPQYKAKVVEKLVIKSKEYPYELARNLLLLSEPADKKLLLKQVFPNIQSIDACKERFIEIAQAASNANFDLLYKWLISTEERFFSVVKYGSHVSSVFKIFNTPKQQQNIMIKVLSNKSLTQTLITSSYELRDSTLSPQCRVLLYEQVIALDFSSVRVSMIKDWLLLFNTTEQQQGIMTKVLSDARLTHELLTTTYVLKGVLEVAPQYRDPLYERVIVLDFSSVRVSMIKDWLLLFNMTEQQQGIMTKVLSDARLTHELLTTTYVLNGVLEVAPQYRDPLYRQIIALDLGSDRASLLEDWLKLFNTSEHQAELMAKILKNPSHVSACFSSDWDKKSIFSKLCDPQKIMHLIAKNKAAMECCGPYLEKNFSQEWSKVTEDLKKGLKKGRFAFFSDFFDSDVDGDDNSPQKKAKL